ncbi:diguanylate cyclase domain-containing protein [Petropleomorpha daqingensis]|uniref:Diguanylate cyclase (GGDEF)-like protein n=1 Tax=Petropleomorpha daqingensis TaxID=2026353 RepID=A0A853CFM5_9ACTN|nr:diguanylate cyclase (GGDEF)-like protein [Petropleomorpha daqingensis]
MTTTVPEPRETSGATTALVLAYVREHGGDAAVAETLRRAAVPFTAEELGRPDHWVGYDTRVRLFTAATEVLGDPETMWRVGSEALSNGLSPALVLIVRAIGSPRQVYRQLPRAVAKFSTTSTMTVLEAGATHATIHYRLHDGYRHSRLDCDYARGLIGMVPVVFGLPRAEVRHDECESDGHPACIYHLTWESRSRLGRRRRRSAEASAEAELVALRGQLRTLQSAASDLVASDDLDAILHTIVARAAQAVLAPAYVLAVTPPAGGAPLVHSAGLPDDAITGTARTLLATGDLGPHAVVVDVASARRRHGRLAAVYPEGHGAIGDERSMLAAYAGHAAAALDLLMALEDARLEADRAGALLALAHELAAAPDADAVCDVVARALPRVVGCSRATIMLWDPASGRLRTRASEGLDAGAAAFAARTDLAAEDTPELVGMLTDREPRVLRDATSSPALRGLLEGLGSTDAVAVPLLAGTSFLGVAAAGWRQGEAPSVLDGDVLVRLRGVGDQASTALQKARLLETVRHQAAHDALTGLPNRVLFLERLTAALERPEAEEQIAVLFCDLDRFKAVNDSLGHAAGDELLRQVAARLLSAVRPGDTVGRLSGDEFAVVLRGLSSPEGAHSLARRVLACFDEPFRLEGREVRIGTSVGVAVHANGDGGPELLLRRADAAMYADKHRDREAPAR